MELEGKTALITGGAKRVGRVVALDLAESGCDIILHHNRSDPSRTVGEIREHGVECTTLKIDLTIPEEYEILSSLDSVDILVNSASTFFRGDFNSTTIESWNQSMAVNLTAPFLMMKHITPLMKGADNLVVNILDGAGLRPWKNYLAHGVSKAALLHLTEVTARTLAPQIRVNGIVPGPVLKTEGMSDEVWSRVYAKTPLGRPGSPQHISSAVKFLAENDYITGETLRIDGGEYLETR